MAPTVNAPATSRSGELEPLRVVIGFIRLWYEAPFDALNPLRGAIVYRV